MRFRTALVLTPAFVLGGCFVVDEAALDRLTPIPDAGPIVTVATTETCGGAGAISIMAGVYSVANGNAIDTRTAVNDVSPLCRPAPGPEVFVQFDATAGQYWHFHVHANNPAPVDGGAPIVADPVLLLYRVNGGSCNTTDCTYVSNKCPAGEDEHFGLEIPSGGEWALGIDNATAFGSRYDVTVFRPTCGNNPTPSTNAPEHGEGCDDGNIAVGDGCDDKCRVELSTSNSGESEPNDDRFWANHVLATSVNAAAQGQFIITGTHTVCDSDTYMVRLDPGQKLTARVQNTSMVAYTPANTPFAFEVRTANGNPTTFSADMNGHAVVVTPTIAAQTDFFVTVGARTDGMADALTPYRIEFVVN